MRGPTEVEYLTIWCHDNNLSLNVNKTKEILVDFRKIKENHIPISINGSSVETVGIRISNTLTWFLNTTCILKKAETVLSEAS